MQQNGLVRSPVMPAKPRRPGLINAKLSGPTDELVWPLGGCLGNPLARVFRLSVTGPEDKEPGYFSTIAVVLAL